MARRLKRHPSTVCREVGRNGARDGYRAAAADQRAEAGRHRPKVPKLVAYPELAAHVQQRLETEKASPVTIAQDLARFGAEVTVSHETIYQAVYAHHRLDPDQKKHLRLDALSGNEIVDNTARLCVMNLLLHGIGQPNGKSPIAVEDSLAAAGKNRHSMVLTNPPFGKKSSMTIVVDGEATREALSVVREDFSATTSNKQLNFVQQVRTILETNGRAAVVVPDNVLFEGGAGETVRRNLLHECDVHTLLRLPTGVFYAQG